MFKLMILIDQDVDVERLEQHWPRFLNMVERMPGLRREATIWPHGLIYGERSFHLIHELFFDSLEAMQTAMASQDGQSAGRTLRWMTDGRMTLLFAQHLEDELSNIQAKTVQQPTGSSSTDQPA